MLPAALSIRTTADLVLFAGRGLWRGWSLIETGGSNPGSAKFYDANKVNTDKPLGFVSVAAAGTSTSFPSKGSAAVERGLYVDVTGTVDLVIYYNTETRALAGLGVFDDGTEDTTLMGLMKLASMLDGD